MLVLLVPALKVHAPFDACDVFPRADAIQPQLLDGFLHVSKTPLVAAYVEAHDNQIQCRAAKDRSYRNEDCSPCLAQGRLLTMSAASEISDAMTATIVPVRSCLLSRRRRIASWSLVLFVSRALRRSNISFSRSSIKPCPSQALC